MKNSVPTGWLEKRRNLPFLCIVPGVQRRELEVSAGRSKLDTVLILFNAMQFNAIKTKFHDRGSAFVADVSYGSRVKKDLNLVYYLMPM